jgi:hypothetical protein
LGRTSSGNGGSSGGFYVECSSGSAKCRSLTLAEGLSTRFPDLYLNGNMPSLNDLIGAVLSEHGLSSDPGVVSELTIVVNDWIAGNVNDY